MFGSPGSILFSIPSRPAARITVAARYGFAAPSIGPVLEPTRRGHADHLRPVVAAVGDVNGRPRGARCRRADDQALVRVHRRRRHADVGLRVLQQASDEVIGELRQAKPVESFGVLEQRRVLLASHRLMWQWQAVAGEVRERLRHEGRAEPRCLCAIEWTMYRRKMSRSAGRQRVRVPEVRLELRRWRPRGRSRSCPSRAVSRTWTASR